MGNECPNNDHENESLIKALNSDQHKNQLKTVRSVKEKKEFARFRDMVLHYEYYHKLLKLAFKNFSSNSNINSFNITNVLYIS